MMCYHIIRTILLHPATRPVPPHVTACQDIQIDLPPDLYYVTGHFTVKPLHGARLHRAIG